MCFRPPSVSKPKKCPSCGTVNPGNLKECRNCKHPLDSGEQKTVEQQSKEQTHKEV